MYFMLIFVLHTQCTYTDTLMRAHTHTHTPQVMRLAVAEVVVFYTTSAVINITNTGVANVMRRAVVELPIAVDRQRIAELEQVVREQHNLETMGERRSR
jgi:alpha-galactosidase/6-phospho-beta-glucosidase family protein